MALSMEQILRRTTPLRLEKATTTVRISKLKLSVSKTTKLPLAVAQGYSKDVNREKKVTYNKYITSILFRKNKKVKISCSCPDFVYAGWEWALWKRGSADIIYGNGEPPDITNPGGLVTGCCKHLAALWFFLQSKKLITPAQRYADKVSSPNDKESKEIYNVEKRSR